MNLHIKKILINESGQTDKDILSSFKFICKRAWLKYTIIERVTQILIIYCTPKIFWNTGQHLSELAFHANHFKTNTFFQLFAQICMLSLTLTSTNTTRWQLNVDPINIISINVPMRNGKWSYYEMLWTILRLPGSCWLRIQAGSGHS